MHNHPMVSQSDVADLNERYAPWTIAKVSRGHRNGMPGRRFETHARHAITGETIYRCEGWSQASRGQALNAILERRASGSASSDLNDARELLIELTDSSASSEETAEVVAWCDAWARDCFGDEEIAAMSDSALLRGCNHHIDGGLAFVLADVRRVMSTDGLDAKYAEKPLTASERIRATRDAKSEATESPADTDPCVCGASDEAHVGNLCPDDGGPYFAITHGLQGGYLPNSVYHVEGIESARSALIDEIERVIGHMSDLAYFEDGETGEKIEHALMGETRLELATLELALETIRAMSAADLRDGYAVAYEHSMIELSPIAAADFDSESE